MPLILRSMGQPLDLTTKQPIIFFDDMVSQVWPQEEAQEKLKKKQSLSYSRVLETGDTACRATRRRPGGQEGGGLGQSLYWGFHWEGSSLPRSPVYTLASRMARGADRRDRAGGLQWAGQGSSGGPELRWHWDGRAHLCEQGWYDSFFKKSR